MCAGKIGNPFHTKQEKRHSCCNQEGRRGSNDVELKETSEVMIHSIVLYMNLRKRLRLLLRSFFSWLRIEIQEWMEKTDFALA